jgi:hypothetical protein
VVNPVAEISNERPTYIARLREAEGNERTISFESPTGEEAQVGDEISIDGAEWQVLAIEPEEPPWAGVLVCERPNGGITRSERSAHLKDKDRVPDNDPPLAEDDLPLHLRVVRAVLDVEAEQKRIDQALALASEIYELEAHVEFEAAAASSTHEPSRQVRRNPRAFSG